LQVKIAHTPDYNLRDYCGIPVLHRRSNLNLEPKLAHPLHMSSQKFKKAMKKSFSEYTNPTKKRQLKA
jgi:hypothetical protein